MPWRPVLAGTAALGTPFGIGVIHPVIGEAFAVIEVVVVLIIIGTALFGSSVLSERAFRLLGWVGNRPESPDPPVQPSRPDGELRPSARCRAP
jgi:hypothetical protein